jgi:polyisoprenoid-binding protein YceI
MSTSIGIVWPRGRRPVAPVALGEPLPAEPTISDGTHPIDLSESFIEWSGRNLLKKHRGRIGLRSGQLEFAHGRLTGGRAVIDLNNIVCSDLHGTEWHDVLINHLRSDDFFDVERFPEALVVITGARRIDDASPERPNLEIDVVITRESARPIFPQIPVSAAVDRHGDAVALP